MTPRHLFATALLCCFTAALFGAAPLSAWVNASIVGGTVVQQATDQWLSLTQELGLGRPYDMLRRAVRAAEDQH